MDYFNSMLEQFSAEGDFLPIDLSKYDQDEEGSNNGCTNIGSCPGGRDTNCGL